MANTQIRKPFIIGGAAVIGVTLVLFLASTFLYGGGDDAPPTAPVTSAAAPAPAVKPAAKVDENKLKSGGRDPFSPRVGAAPARAPISAPVVVEEAAATVHTWQLLDVKDGIGSFLVDGKKIAGVDLKKEIVKGYKFNSVSGATCVTVTVESKAFGLCEGGTPFSA